MADAVLLLPIVKLYYFQVLNFTVVQFKAQHGAGLMKSMLSHCPRIHMEKPGGFIGHYL